MDEISKMILIETTDRKKYRYLIRVLNFFCIVYMVKRKQLTEEYRFVCVYNDYDVYEKKIINLYQIFCNVTSTTKNLIMNKIEMYNKNVNTR